MSVTIRYCTVVTAVIGKETKLLCVAECHFVCQLQLPLKSGIKIALRII
jgi:hypothetical protein